MKKNVKYSHFRLTANSILKITQDLKEISLLAAFINKGGGFK